MKARQMNENDLNTYIGQQIRHHRRKRGISMERLADTLGVTYQQVQKIERGKNRVSAARLCVIAHVLRTPLVAFVPATTENDQLE